MNPLALECINPGGMDASNHRPNWVARVDTFMHVAFLLVAAIAIWQSLTSGGATINYLLFP